MKTIESPSVTITPHADPDGVVTTVHGNLFAHLGFDPAQAVVLAMRADLVAQMRLIIQANEWTQQETAQHLRLTQPRVSDLFRGKTDKFSLDMLITLATRAGRKVELAVV